MPALQASIKLATLKGENDSLKAQIAQLQQRSRPAEPSAAINYSARDDAEPEDLQDSEEAESECTGTACNDSRRSSCVSALEASGGSMIDHSFVTGTSPDASVCDDGSGDGSMLSAECIADKSASNSVLIADVAGAEALTSPPRLLAPVLLSQIANSVTLCGSNDVSCIEEVGVARAEDVDPQILNDVPVAPVEGKIRDGGE
jgi:hypothetical protein